MQIADYGDERVVVRRDGKKVARWHSSQVGYDKLAEGFTDLLERQIARSRP
jgi:hypothetical protein